MKLSSIHRFLCRVLPIHLVQVITSVLPNTSFTVKIRGAMMRPFFKKCGKNFRIASGVTINRPDQIEIGDNVYIAHNCWMNGTGGLFFDNDIQVGPMCVIVTSKHIYEDGKVKNESQPAPVRIQSGTWLASHVVVTDGVTIGEGVIVGAGAVVTSDTPSHCVVGGVPAKPIKALKSQTM